MIHSESWSAPPRLLQFSPGSTPQEARLMRPQPLFVRSWLLNQKPSGQSASGGLNSPVAGSYAHDCVSAGSSSTGNGLPPVDSPQIAVAAPVTGVVSGNPRTGAKNRP